MTEIEALRRRVEEVKRRVEAIEIRSERIAQRVEKIAPETPSAPPDPPNTVVMTHGKHRFGFLLTGDRKEDEEKAVYCFRSLRLAANLPAGTRWDGTPRGVIASEPAHDRPQDYGPGRTWS